MRVFAPEAVLAKRLTAVTVMLGFVSGCVWAWSEWPAKRNVSLSDGLMWVFVNVPMFVIIGGAVGAGTGVALSCVARFCGKRRGQSCFAQEAACARWFSVCGSVLGVAIGIVSLFIGLREDANVGGIDLEGTLLTLAAVAGITAECAGFGLAIGWVVDYLRERRRNRRR